jgi:hypothetical protein
VRERAHDAAGFSGRAPEVHPADVVRLGDDALGEAERLERLDAARLDAVGLAEHEAPVARSMMRDDVGYCDSWAASSMPAGRSRR